MQSKTVTSKSEALGDRLVISLEDAAWRLSVSPSFLRLEIARGSIRPVRLGRRVLISEAEIERYVTANTCGARGEPDAEEASIKKAQ